MVTIQFKICPRCHGDMNLKEDNFGTYLSCLQCGYLRDVDAPYLRRGSGQEARINEEYGVA